jgi:2-dehydropantoate 2-reductase
MKIAIVGCGAVGSYYGAKLCRAGNDVHFLLRTDFDVVRRNGVSIRSPDGDFHVRPACAKSAGEIGPCDVVLIGLKTTANGRFAELLPPLVGEGTAIVTLQNGLGNEEALAALFPPSQILGGLCFVCLNRIEPGLIRHLDHGLVVLGEFGRPSEARTHGLGRLFSAAGVPCRVTENLHRAHWEKLVWNIPFNGLGVAASAGTAPWNDRRPAAAAVQATGPCLTTERLLADAGWSDRVRELMLEVIRSANALGLAIEEDLADQQIERTRTMGAYKASTLIDFELGRPLEVENLFVEPLRRARAAGVSTPRLETLCEILRQLDPGRDAGNR